MRESMEGNDFYADEALAECLDFPEMLEELTREQALEVLRLAEARIFEIYDHDIKAKYQRLIQQIKTKLLGGASDAAQIPSANIQDSYVIDTPEGKTTLRVTVGNLGNFHQAALLGVPIMDLNRKKSVGLACNINDKQHRFWINLKMFGLVRKNGTVVRAVFIADWYVSPGMRDCGIGRQLQEIAEKIARDNRCTTIFSQLVPEDPKDLERLKAAKRKMGYKIQETQNGLVAKKRM